MTDTKVSKAATAEAERANLVLEYLEAFRQANPDAEPPTIQYAGGWFILSPHKSRYRKAKLEAMRDTLRARVARPTQ